MTERTAEASAAPPSESTTGIDRIVLGVVALGALVSVLLILPYRSFDLDRFLAPKELVVHITILLAGVLVAIRARTLAWDTPAVLLSLFVGLTVLSVVFATNRWVSVRATELTVSAALAFWAGRHLQRVGLDGALARVLAFAATVGAITALLQAYGVSMEWAALSRAPGGTFGNRNFMAHLTAAGVPLVLYAIVTARGWLSTVLWSAAMTLCASALVLSRTRASWLALMAWGAGVALLLLRGPSVFEVAGARLRTVVALVATVAGIAAALLIPNRLDWKSDNPYLESVKGVVNYKEGSGAGRLRQYQNSVRMALAYPLVGVGAGNWPVMYPKFAPANDPSMSETTGMTANPWPSSDWVATLSERGIAAFVVWTSFLATLLVIAVRVRYDDARSPHARMAALAGASVIVIAAIEGAFDAVLLLPINALIVMLVAGAMIPPGTPRRSAALGRGGRTLLVVGVGLVAGIASVQGGGRVLAMAQYMIGSSTSIVRAAQFDPGNLRVRVRAAETFIAAGRCKQARPHAQAALRLFPSSPMARRVASACGKER